MRFLLSWVVRIGLVLAVAGVMGSSQIAAAVLNNALLVYLVFAAWSRLRVDVPRLWRLTSLRSIPRGASRIRLGRLKGDTL